jgi:hypothetical protein
MTRRVGTIVALVAVTGILAVPASQALAGGGPVAHTSGALINFVTAGKLKIQRTMQPLVQCSAACNVTGTGTLKGMGLRASFSDASPPGMPFAAGELFGLAVTVGKPLVKAMKAHPGRFRLNETLTATDATTGAPDSISQTFKFKR